MEANDKKALQPFSTKLKNKRNYLDNLKNKRNNIVDECPEEVFDSSSYKGKQKRKYKGVYYNVYEHLGNDYALSIVLSLKQ